MLAKNHDLTAWELASNQPRCLQPVDMGHADVHHNDVGQEMLCFFEDVKTVASFAADFQLRSAFEYRTETPAKDFVIVSEENAWSFGLHAVWTSYCVRLW